RTRAALRFVPTITHRLTMASMDSPPSDRVASARFLREHDKIGGYLPSLAMPTDAAEGWTELWAQIRSFDDATEAGTAIGPFPELGPLVRRRHPELVPVLDELTTWPALEATLSS